MCLPAILACLPCVRLLGVISPVNAILLVSLAPAWRGIRRSCEGAVLLPPITGAAH
jgi:hypothetical protein